MASKIDFSNLTLNPEEARSTSEVVFEDLYIRPEIANVHGIMTEIEMDKYIPFLGQLGLVGKSDPGSCGVNDDSSQIPTSQKVWQPKLVSFRQSHCQSNVPQLLKFWKRARIAANTWEEVDNEMMAFITDTITEATLNSVIRIAEFGDTAADVVGSGGDLTAGTDKAFFNILNGMWQQVFTDQAGSAESYRYTIPENGAASKVAQYSLADDRALLMFRSMYNNIDPRAFESGNLVFQVTRSLWNNWNDFLENKSLGFTLDRAEKGSSVRSYREIPIVVRTDWDRIRRAYYDKGTTYYLPHMAMLTDINNIPIGTSDEGSMSELRSFYRNFDKKWYFDVAYKIDQKNLQEYKMAVAY